MSDYNAVDLSSVLRTLSAFANQPPYHQQSTLTPVVKPNEEDDAYEPSDSLPQMPSRLSQPESLPPNARSHSTPGRSSHHPSSASPASAPSTSAHPHTRTSSSNEPGDPSMITTWSGARSYVMKAMLQNEDLHRRIHRLIQRQHDHERQWWQGREALLAKQKARVQKKKELDEVLRSVGAPVDSKQVSTAEEDQAELQNYDAKVYKASKQMADAMVLEMRALRIPFFAIQPHLVAASQSSSRVQDTPRAGGEEKDPSVLSRQSLASFQQRVLKLLQDLCEE